jgi:hypothetical protein
MTLIKTDGRIDFMPSPGDTQCGAGAARVRRKGLPFAFVFGLAILVPIIGGYAVAGGWAWWQFGSRAAAVAFLRGESLVLDPQSFDMGTIRQKERRFLRLRAINLTGKPIAIHGLQGYCNNQGGCVSSRDQFPVVVEPRAGRGLTVEYEYRAQPEARQIHITTEVFTELGNFEIALNGHLLGTGASGTRP